MKPIVILGAGQAGGRAAEALRENGYAGPIVLVGEELHAPYERPPLSKGILTGEKDAASAAVLPVGYYADKDIRVVTGMRATRIDVPGRSVRLADGTSLEFDRLILATGSRVRTLPFAPIGRPGVHYLRTLQDAADFGGVLKKATRLTIIGGGFLGLEVAASATKLGVKPTVVEIAPQLMDRAMAPAISRHIQAKHSRHGVEFRLGVSAAEIVGNKGVEAVRLSDGTSLAADLVLVAIGVVPNVELAKEAGIDVSDGIVVDEHGATSLLGIFAVGEVANHPNAILGRRIRLESWQHAQNHAIAVARGLAGTPSPYNELPWFWSDQFDWNIQMVGVPLASDEVIVRGDPASNRFVCFNMCDGVVHGATAINSGGEMRPIRQLIASARRYPPQVLADPTQKLRDIAATT